MRAMRTVRETDRKRQSAGQRQRKSDVLTHETASVVRSITTAVVVKNGEPFFICPPEANLPLDERHGFGLYHHDTRYLSGYELTIGGAALTSLASTAAAGTFALFQLSNPELDLPGGMVEKETLDVRWTRAVDSDGPALRDELVIHNLGFADVRFPLAIRLSVDFRDMFAVRGLLDERPGRLLRPRWDGPRLIFAYNGKDGVRRELHTRFDPAPTHTDGAEATYDIALRARATTQLRLEFGIHERAKPGVPPIETRRDGRGARVHGATSRTAEPGEWIGEGEWSTSVRTESLILSQVLSRSLNDLALLRTRLDGFSFYEAGIPWFATLFGRDSLISALQALAFETQTAANTLRLLASRQGTKDVEWRDEEPGRILHEFRVGELARLGEIPHNPYYGSIDATLLFLILVARHAAWTGTLDLFHELRDNVERALAWLERTEARFGGYIAYQSTTKHGLVNQGWKDSGDAIVRADGHLAQPPIALAEVQGYSFLARRLIAELFERDGDPERAERLREDAEALQRRFEADFWSEDMDCYALALEANGNPCKVATSNAGQVLWTGIASPDRARRVAHRLLAPDMFSGWGIRTLSADAMAYTPIGYHRGTVWPHDNALIAAGFRRYGLFDEAEEIMSSLLEAALDFEHQRLPECFAGYARAEYGMPVRYPVACHPQAWAAAATPYLLETSLGLNPNAFERRLRVVDPRLPAFVGDVELKGVKVGDGRAHLKFVRNEDGRVRVDVVSVDGELDVEVQAATSPGPAAASDGHAVGSAAATSRA
jgi:glycogen debranching enzyme